MALAPPVARQYTASNCAGPVDVAVQHALQPRIRLAALALQSCSRLSSRLS
ncbi:hypothetical protein [Ralstonia solanacearum]|uniref:hypothetical protein n=1 Tax=Ralstonia solanacearum TaxID=305 RepID=UPI001650E8DD|nr:hypothetical protein [Ralstonia solanacearum]